MKSHIPARLQRGDIIRVVAPARSRTIVLEPDYRDVISSRFSKLGLTVTFGRHVDEFDNFDSSSMRARVEDLHEAFADPDVSGILTAIGGFNSNELLPHLDWTLIRGNPKVLCGYSDITALQNAILTKTGLVTYSGPHWSTFGMIHHFDQTQEWFRQAVFEFTSINLEPAEFWTDDRWFINQNGREDPFPGDGWWPLRAGHADGRIIGTNLSTLKLLTGTPYMPSLRGAVLMLEDDAASHPGFFARDLTSLLQVPDACRIAGLVLGRFQRASNMTRQLLEMIVERQPVLQGLPVLANVEFGHTFPLATLPIGGRAQLQVDSRARLIISH